MVVFLLKMKADLENVKTIDIPPDHTWILDALCMMPAFQYNCAAPACLGCCCCSTANFLIRWDGSKQVSTVNIQQIKNVTRSGYNAADSGKLIPVVAFECRGVEPVKWYPASGYSVRSAQAIFPDVDLSEDWADYDEEAKQPVGIYELEYEFQPYK